MKKLIIFVCLLHTSGSIAQTATWQQVTTPTTKDLNCIVFPSPQVGYIGGADSVLLKTIDGGITWTQLAYSGINFYPGGDSFMELDFITNDIGFATVGPYSGTYKTVDGGLTWTVLTNTLCYNHGLYFFNEQEGFVGGAGCFQGEQLLKFTAGIEAPVTITTPTWQATDLIVDIDFDLNMFGSVGLAVSAGGRILRTTDSGLNWDTIPSSLGNFVPLTAVTIVNSNLAYVAYDNGGAVGSGLLISTNGGLTWSLDVNTATFYNLSYNDVYSNNLERTFAAATASVLNAGVIMESDNSNLWNIYLVDNPINSITSYSDTVIWGAGKNGYLVKNIATGTLSLNELSLEGALKLSPNPARDFFTVQFPNDTDNSNAVIEVYGMDGRRIKTGEPGQNSVQVSDLSTGEYLVHVTQGVRIWSTKFIKL